MILSVANIRAGSDIICAPGAADLPVTRGRVEFDVESFGYILKPVECAMNCVSYDWANDVRHRHCEATMGFDVVYKCNALVLVEEEDFGFTIEPENGCKCSVCDLPTCKNCTHSNTPNGKPMCDNCYHAAVNEEMRGFDYPALVEAKRPHEMTARELRQALMQLSVALPCVGEHGGDCGYQTCARRRLEDTAAELASRVMGSVA